MFDKVNCIWDILLISPFCLDFVFASVQLTVDQKEIEIGKSLLLGCKVLNGNITGNRKWLGGQQSDLICLNGVTKNPAKYTEEEISKREYKLRIYNVSEEDLNCPYACRFGFQSAEETISVRKYNFKKIPTDETVRTEYVKVDGTYKLEIEFQKVFPIPSCLAKIKFRSQNLTLAQETRDRILYNVKFKDQSGKPFHSCDSPVEIECLFGNTTYPISIKHNFECSNSIHVSNIKPTTTKVLVTLSVVTIVLLVCVITFFTRRNLRRKRLRLQKEAELNECSAPLNIDLKLAMVDNMKDDVNVIVLDSPDEKSEITTLPLPVPSPDETRGGNLTSITSI